MNPRGFYHFGSFRLDPVARVLTRDGKPVPITGKAFETLLVLVRNQGRVVPKDELMAAVWPDTVVEESSLAQSVSTIRKVLGEKVGEHRYIVTASGRGYSFVAGVRQTASFERLPPLREWAILPTLVIAFAGVWLLSGHSGSNSAGWPPKIVPFTDYPGVEEFPAFSPDGKQIAFVWGGENQENEDIYVKRIGAGTPLRLTTNPAADVFPAWSPDGRSIAFVRAGSDGGGILTVPASGGAERRILKLSAGGYVCNGIAWLPDGKSLAVPIKSRAEDPTAIMAVPVDGGKARRLTSPPRNTIGDSSPSYSPDGKTLAFLRSATVSEADIYMMPASGGQVRQVSFDHTWFSGFSWTADGSAIIASSGRVGINGLWRYPVERGWFSRATPTVVLPGEGQEFPTVSPAGGYLAYAQGSANLNIWRLDLTNLSPTANPAKFVYSTGQQSDASYSADGRKIAFWSDRSGAHEIWVSDGSGHNAAQLTKFGGPHTGSPRFSPDGSRIAFDSRPDGNPDIFVVGSEGGTPRRVTTEASEDVVPSWSRDGRWIYFASNRGGAWQVWKTPAAGGSLVQVTQHGGFAGAESWDGRYYYYSKSREEGGLWRVPTQGGEETAVIPKLRCWGWWTPGERGIYFVESADGSPGASLMFYRFDSEKVEELARLPKAPTGMTPSMALSPDGRWLLLSQVDQVSSDIKLVENFH